jgi:predicted secreted protein
MDLNTATPVEIDTELARLWGEINGRLERIQRSMGDLHRIAGDKGRWVNASRKAYELSDAQAEAKVREFIATGDEYSTRSARSIIEMIDEARDFNAQDESAVQVLEAEYENRGRWSRFFLVTSSNGHIHSSMHCSTCGIRTKFAWLPGASGQTEAEAIAERDKLDSAALLCTVCFPNAPVKWTEKPADAAVCPGSGTWDYPAETARKGYAAGNYGICRHCSQPITISKLGKMRKHKRA